MWELSNKLHKIRSDIRKEQLASLMKRERSQLQRTHDEALINDLISLPTSQFGEDELHRLVELANKDLSLAIAHLGNLTIDRFLTAQILAVQEWQLGSDDKWPWLINAFTEIGFCTPAMLEYCVRRIITKRSLFSLENAMEALLKAFRLGPACLEYFRQADLVLALANHAFDSSDRVSQLVLTLLTTASSEDEQLPHNILEVLGQARLTRVLQQGLMKIPSVHRALTVQIANNFLLSGIPLEVVRVRILELAQTEKEQVKLEVSYYLKAFAENAPEESILAEIKRSRLLETLQSYVKISSPNPKYDWEIATNAVQAQ
jgi:hypothetical protein